MKIVKAMALVVVALSVAACSRTANFPTTQTTLPPATSMTGFPEYEAPQPTQSAPIQQARLDPGNYAYIDGAALSSLSPAQRSAANDAQFYALQFGRPGAPRSWSAAGASGQVSVGPYVRVNNLDCREFSHRVTVGGQTHTKSGTACREADGAWGVVSA